MGRKPINQDAQDDMIELRKQGLSYKNISDYLGIGIGTVRWVVNPIYKRNRKKQIARYYKKNRESLLESMRKYNAKNLTPSKD